MPAEGGIVIELSRCGKPSAGANITSSRPLGMPRMFVGRAPAEVAHLVPLMFSVCGMAQGAAATSACETALNLEPCGATRVSRSLLVLAETTREHLIRALQQWPEAIGEASCKSALYGLMRDWQRLRAAADPTNEALSVLGIARLDDQATRAAIAGIETTIESNLLGEAIAVFAARSDIQGLQAWSASLATPAQRLVHHVLSRGWAGAGAADACLLPGDAAVRLATELFGDRAGAFVARPALDGQANETNAFSRQAASPLCSAVRERYGSALLARIVAAIVEAAALPGMMRDALAGAASAASTVTSVAVAPDGAIASVEAARGRLMHAVTVAAGTISHYAILAPTEWNFHPRGAAASGLMGIAAAGHDVRELARLFVGTLDPCVAFELRIA